MLVLIGLFIIPGCFGIDSFVCNPNCVVAMANGTNLCNSTTGECRYGCKPGQAGPNCSFVCPSNCELHAGKETETCNATTGQCLYGCQLGYAGPNCSVECPKTCASSNIRGTEICNTTTEECLFGCLDGYYGARCENKCDNAVYHCKKCSVQNDSRLICDECIHNSYRVNGKCLFCNYWCNYKNSSPLRLCRENDGYCNHGCKKNHYGFTCGQQCQSCKDECDRKRGHCLTGCSSQFYCGPTCELVCSDGCTSQDCEQSCTCRLGCTRKKWGDKCDKFCSVNCNEPPDLKSNVCERSNGSCSYRCYNDTFWGSQCDKKCSSTCNRSTCDEVTGHCTDGCISKKVHGLGCDKACNKNCVNGTCERSDGECDSGCVSGSYGEKCHLNCNEHCVDNTCNRSNGYCNLGCINGWHGTRCNNECHGNCLHSTCEQKSGHCTRGCLTGWFGYNCSFQCSRSCLNLVCNREDGNCSYGLVDTILNTDLIKGSETYDNLSISTLVSGWLFFIMMSVVVLRKYRAYKVCKLGKDAAVKNERGNRITQQYTTLQREVGFENPAVDYENLRLEEGGIFPRPCFNQVQKEA